MHEARTCQPPAHLGDLGRTIQLTDYHRDPRVGVSLLRHRPSSSVSGPSYHRLFSISKSSGFSEKSNQFCLALKFADGRTHFLARKIDLHALGRRYSSIALLAM